MDVVTRGNFFARQGWYPGDAAGCERRIAGFLEELDRITLPDGPLVAGIVPHAGWFFSGKLATLTIGALARSADPETVVLLGGHLGPRSPSWILQSGVWPTPLGDMDVDAELAAAVAKQTGLDPIDPDEYSPDNTIELQMPILRDRFGGKGLVVAGVPASSDAVEVGRGVARAARELGRKVVVVGSTDMTHYGPNYGFSPAGGGAEAVRWVKEDNDKRGVDLMVALDGETLLSEALDKHFCCCPGSTAAAIGAASELGAKQGHVLATLTSYDVQPGSSFVGYASVVF